MYYYEIWVNLMPGASDLQFVRAMTQFMSDLATEQALEGYRIRRRCFGFGPEALGEFNVTISFKSLDQMDRALTRVASRRPDIEAVHSAVFSIVQDFRSGLYRDFPDASRDLNL